MNKTLIGLIGLSVLSIFFIAILFLALGTDVPTDNISIGDIRTLHNEGYNQVVVCTSKENLNALIDTAIAKDTQGYKDIIFSDKCFMASTINDLGIANIRILERGIGIYKFRFIDEDSWHYNQVAWTYQEYIK